MSLFQFLASDILLKDVKNPNMEFISINEAIERNIENTTGNVMNISDIDKDKKCIMICDSEEHLYEIEVKYEMYHHPIYAKEYSQKKYFSELHLYYTEDRAKQLINYLKEQLEVTDEIEIWRIWLDEHNAPSVKSTYINELCIADLKFLDIADGYKKPKCLVVKK